MGAERRRLLPFGLALGLVAGRFVGASPVAIAASVPVSITTVHGAFYSNPNNSGQQSIANYQKIKSLLFVNIWTV